ncbi:metal ABC transporter ATP-binding protein [Candidatus Phycosocius spiralis]|uniref:Zinc/manganese transport system ATP-binding protein n=1 Tax=Candidatus Phycosocius spiralis TaxID=2815099 RepID=A0ABQ4PWL1_9PROT|nr:ATP-binding cassette domain-containing protein [Candidatus Phycosocius spiralis]GIU67408.1 zinc/manganese transport system ATP-binding protein [Candidatus Phycosocius spiralis]
MSLIIHDLSIGYPKRLVMAGVCARVEAGSAIALIGQNGTGKSTLLKTLAGEIPALAGSYSWNAETPAHRGIAWLSQSPSLKREAPISVLTLVGTGLWARLGLFGRPCRHDRDLIDHALEQVGLFDMRHLQVKELSGGLLQRALFARVAVQDCGLILLDEPFSGVDQASCSKLLDLISSWVSEGRTVIAALHDLDSARQFPQWWELSKFGAFMRRAEEKPHTSISQLSWATHEVPLS